MDCVFCKIAEGSVPSARVYEDAHLVAFDDLHPQAKVHVLVVPRRHVPTADDLGAADVDLAGRLLLAAAEVARAKGIARDGYRLLLNCNRHGGQEVFHLHVHLVGGEPLGPMLTPRSR